MSTLEDTLLGGLCAWQLVTAAGAECEGERVRRARLPTSLGGSPSATRAIGLTSLVRGIFDEQGAR